jgi:folylpolyglutamate synthase/dihydropteroate synthase
MEDKDYPQILSILLTDLSYGYREIICVTPDSARSLPAQKLRKYIEDHFSGEALFYKNQTTMYNRQGKIFAFDEAKEACIKAVEDSAADFAPILCIGSLYLAGQVRNALKQI